MSKYQIQSLREASACVSASNHQLFCFYCTLISFTLPKSRRISLAPSPELEPQLVTLSNIVMSYQSPPRRLSWAWHPITDVTSSWYCGHCYKRFVMSSQYKKSKRLSVGCVLAGQRLLAPWQLRHPDTYSKRNRNLEKECHKLWCEYKALTFPWATKWPERGLTQTP